MNRRVDDPVIRRYFAQKVAMVIPDSPIHRFPVSLSAPVLLFSDSEQGGIGSGRKDQQLQGIEGV